MKSGKPITVTLRRDNIEGRPTMFRQYEIVKLMDYPNRVIYNMVLEAVKPDAAGTCTVNLRVLNTSKWGWIAKIQIKIFKRLLREPKTTQP